MNAKLFVISAPSGGGKSTVIDAILESDKTMAYSVSVTTRKPRQSEINAVSYYFVPEQEFLKMIETHQFLEWAKVHGDYYGTLKAPIDTYLKTNRSVLLDIDVQGGLSVKKQLPEAVLIFLLPPSMALLTKRLMARGTESPEDVGKRLKAAQKEISYAAHYDFQVVNNHLKQTVNAVKMIINKSLKTD